jgi:hypothetical protein
MDESYFIEFSKQSHTSTEWERHRKDCAKFQNKKLKELKNEILMIDYKKILKLGFILNGILNENITSIIMKFTIIEQLPLYVIETRELYDDYELDSIHLNKDDVYDRINKSETLYYRDEGRVRMYLLNSDASPFNVINFDHDKIEDIDCANDT